MPDKETKAKCKAKTRAFYLQTFWISQDYKKEEGDVWENWLTLQCITNCSALCNNFLNSLKKEKKSESLTTILNISRAQWQQGKLLSIYYYSYA